MGEHPGLARTRAGDDQQRPVAVDDGLPLRGVQPLQELCVRRHPLTLPTAWDAPRTPSGLRSGSREESNRRPEPGRRRGPHRAQPLASPTVADGRIARLRARVTEGVEWAPTTAWQPVVVGPGRLRTGPRHRRRAPGRRPGLPAVRLVGGVRGGDRRRPRVHRCRRGRRRRGPQRGGHHRHRRQPDQRRRRRTPGGDAGLLLIGGLYALFSTSRTMVRALWTSSQIAARTARDQAAGRSRASWPTTGSCSCSSSPSAEPGACGTPRRVPGC